MGVVQKEKEEFYASLDCGLTLSNIGPNYHDVFSVYGVCSSFSAECCGYVPAGKSVTFVVLVPQRGNKTNSDLPL